MTKHYAMSAVKRDRAGKGVARSLRRESRLPGVIYGGGTDPQTISLPWKDVSMEYHKGHMFTTLCDLDLDGEKHLVLARDVQIHPVTDDVLHVDFLRVTPKTTINVSVPVHFVNEENSPGLKRKGTLTIVRHEIEMVCLATDIPEAIEIDLTPFNIGDAIKISSVKLPKGTKPAITNRDFTIATIAPPRLLVEEETEATGEEASGEAAASEE